MENALLYQRLLGSSINGFKYVLDVNQTGCTMEYDVAKELFDQTPWDSNLVPDECVKYVEDPLCKQDPGVLPAEPGNPVELLMDSKLDQFHGVDGREQSISFSVV